MIACNPSQLLLVTTTCQYNIIQNLCKSINIRSLKVLQIPVANKRLQVCEAIPLVETSITVIADDDIIWPSKVIPWLLAPFEDKKIDGVGTRQRVKRLKTKSLTKQCYNWLNAAYITRRNFEISATHFINGGTSYMSGRTYTFITAIIQAPDFLIYYGNKKWRKHNLKANNNNFITRWLVSHQ